VLSVPRVLLILYKLQDQLTYFSIFMQKIVTLSELRRAQDEKTARSRAHPETLNFERGLALRRKKIDGTSRFYFCRE